MGSGAVATTLYFVHSQWMGPINFFRYFLTRCASGGIRVLDLRIISWLSYLCATGAEPIFANFIYNFKFWALKLSFYLFACLVTYFLNFVYVTFGLTP